MELVTAMYIFREVDTTSNTSIGYIQYSAYEPFVAISFTEDQMKTLSACRWRHSILCLDATGTSILRSTDTKKKIYYYALILEGDKGDPTLPVADMMSTSHSMPTICHFIMLVRRSVAQIQRGKLPKLPQIETDFSWATSCMHVCQQHGHISISNLSLWRKWQHHNHTCMCCPHITSCSLKMRQTSQKQALERDTRQIILPAHGAKDITCYH